jgi:phosphohistidine swiveling domain-containing protein
MPDYFDIIKDKIIKMGMELVKVSKDISSNLKDKDNDALLKAFVVYDMNLQKYAVFAWATQSIEKILSVRIKEELKSNFPKKSDEELDRIFSILSLSRKESTAMQEYKALLKIAAEPEEKRNIGKVCEKFFWLGAVSVGWTYTKEPYDINHYKIVVSDLAKLGPIEKLNEISQKDNKRQKEYLELVKEIKISEKLFKDTKLLSEYISLRTERGEYITHSMVYAKEILKEISKRFNIKFEDIIYFLPSEIVELIQEGRVPNFQPRKSGFNILIDGKKVIITLALAKQSINTKERIVRGNIACRGRAEGLVKIITDLKDISKVQSGDVLVTKMTSPDMIMAIHKAVAIVTDEGGISCHAAIISREFGVPCIVGTRNATHVLKDGDFVKVDAERGIIEVIKK